MNYEDSTPANKGLKPLAVHESNRIAIQAEAPNLKEDGLEQSPSEKSKVGLTSPLKPTFRLMLKPEFSLGLRFPSWLLRTALEVEQLPTQIREFWGRRAL